MFASLTKSDWIGLVGILISLLGFAVAIYQLRKTKTAAESAQDAALKATDGVQKLDSLLEVASFSQAVQSIKRSGSVSV